MFDEEPDGDPHGECAAEIKRLETRLAEAIALLAAWDNCDAITIDRDFPQAEVDEAEAIWDRLHTFLRGTGSAPAVEPKCSDHPDAPHGFDRNGSHMADRYVCRCEGWEPDSADVAQISTTAKGG